MTRSHLPRRGPLAGAVAAVVVAVLALAGCTAGVSAPRQDQPTRTVTDATGNAVPVPVHPRRVVALADTDLDAATALGVVPVGISNARMSHGPPDYLKDKLPPNVSIVGNQGNPNLERIIALKPDLILAGNVRDQNLLNKLRQVTPAVFVSNGLRDDWKTGLRHVADALNKQQQGEDWLRRYDRRVDQVKGEIAGNGGTASIVRWMPQGPSMMLKQQFASLVLADLGLPRPPSVPDGVAPTDPLSLEQLGTVDADWMFLASLEKNPQAALAKAQHSPGFAQLRAARAHHVVTVAGPVWTGRGGPQAALQVISDVEKAVGGK